MTASPRAKTGGRQKGTPNRRKPDPASSALPPYRLERTDRLVPYARNARTHSPEQITQLAASIREFGFTNPVLIDGERGIIAGHGRVLAAQSLAMDVVPVIELSHLTDEQRRAYILADNRLALAAGWDVELLRLEVSQLRDDGFDLRLTGFAAGELSAMLAEPTFAAVGADEQGRLDERSPITCPGCGHRFTTG